MRDLLLRGGICTALHSNALIRITAYQSGTCTTLESVKLKSYFGQWLPFCIQVIRAVMTKVSEYQSGTCTT